MPCLGLVKGQPIRWRPNGRHSWRFVAYEPPSVGNVPSRAWIVRLDGGGVGTLLVRLSNISGVQPKQYEFADYLAKRVRNGRIGMGESFALPTRDSCGESIAARVGFGAIAFGGQIFNQAEMGAWQKRLMEGSERIEGGESLGSSTDSEREGRD